MLRWKEAAMSGERRQEEVHSGAHKRHTETRLVLGGFAVMLVIGGTLMTLLLGPDTAAVGVAFIALALVLLLAVFKGLDLLDAWLRSQR